LQALRRCVDGRFFHGFYNCCCYLPMCILCEDYLLAAKLRLSDIDSAKGAEKELERIIGQIREVWPKVKILLRGEMENRIKEQQL
jgi:hypothetical protein